MHEEHNHDHKPHGAHGGTLFGAVAQYRILFALVLAFGALALAVYAYTTWKQSQYMYYGPMTIQVEGEGEVVARPDIATFSFSVMSEAETAEGAQQHSAESINTIMEYLESEGIKEEDIRTSYYNLYPKYEYVAVGAPEPAIDRGGFVPRNQELVGYTVDQTIEVKVRETDKAGSLIAGAGERGATNISGLRFTIDDESALMAEAREKAIADAKEKAKKLADDLGVRIVKMTAFWEDGNGRYPMDGYGYGGDMAVMESSSIKSTAPSVPTGENTIAARVHITYEIK